MLSLLAVDSRRPMDLSAGLFSFRFQFPQGTLPVNYQQRQSAINNPLLGAATTSHHHHGSQDSHHPRKTVNSAREKDRDRDSLLFFKCSMSISYHSHHIIIIIYHNNKPSSVFLPKGWTGLGKRRENTSWSVYARDQVPTTISYNYVVIFYLV